MTLNRLPRLAFPASTLALVAALACSDSTGPTRPTILSLDATGPTDTLGLTDTVRVRAVARGDGGAELPAVDISWRSLHPLVASVDDAGLVTGLAAGNASIVATAHGRTDVADTVVVRVRPLPRSISIGGLADTVRAEYLSGSCNCARDTALATVRDARGATLAVPVRWSSSDTLVIKVGTTGFVTATNPGAAWVRADAGRGVADSVLMRATARRIAGPAFSTFRQAQFNLNSSPIGFGCGLSTTGDALCSSSSVATTVQLVPGGRRFSALGTSNGTACGLVVADSTLACWGDNARAALGIGTTSPSSVTTPVLAAGGRKFRAFDVGNFNTVCAVGAADSLVYCWGNNENGATGAAPVLVDSTVDPVPGLPKALAVAVGSWHACAIVVDGSIWCWGDAGFYANVSGLGSARARPPAQVAPAAGYASIVATDQGACMLDGAGTLRCAMRRRDGVGTILRSLPAASIPGGAMARISGSRFDPCGVSSSGALLCVQMSYSDDALTTLVAKPGLQGRTAIDASATFSTLCAVTDDHALQCW